MPRTLINSCQIWWTGETTYSIHVHVIICPICLGQIEFQCLTAALDLLLGSKAYLVFMQPQQAKTYQNKTFVMHS